MINLANSAPGPASDTRIPGHEDIGPPSLPDSPDADPRHAPEAGIQLSRPSTYTRT